MPINEAQVELDQAIQSAVANNIDMIISPFLELINSTPELLSLLYDLDIMPEQVASIRDALYLYTVCEAFRLGRKSALDDYISPNEMDEIRAAIIENVDNTRND